MQVFVISSEERYIDEHSHVEAVRTSMEKAEAYIRAQGRVVTWEPRADGSAFAVVKRGSRRRRTEYLYWVRAFVAE